MVKAKSKKSVSEQMKKKFEDFGIFFELLLDKIRTPKGAIIAAVLACLVIGGGVLAVRACVENRVTNNSEPKTSEPKTSTSTERRANSNTKSSSGVGTSETKKTEDSEDKNSPNGSNSATNRRSNRRANSESGSDRWVPIDGAAESSANPAPAPPENNTAVEDSSSSEPAQEPAQEPTGDTGESSGVSDNTVTEAPSTGDSEPETPSEATEPTE